MANDKYADWTSLAIRKRTAKLVDQLAATITRRENRLSRCPKGEAVHIRSAVPLSNLDRKQRDVAAAMKDALRYWRFAPARDSNGQLVPAEIVLPTTFVSG